MLRVCVLNPPHVVPPVIPPAVSLWLEFDNITEGVD